LGTHTKEVAGSVPAKADGDQDPSPISLQDPEKMKRLKTELPLNATLWQRVGIEELEFYHGKEVSAEEKEGVHSLRMLIDSIPMVEKHNLSPWLGEGLLDDREILRFLRASHLNQAEAWGLLSKVSTYRLRLGLDAPTLDPSVLPAADVVGEEMFFMGETRDGCPTLVVRSALHFPGHVSSADYLQYIGQLLEVARREWGLGVGLPICALVDRHQSTRKNYDRALLLEVLPNFQEYYPELLGTVYIAPVNLLFWAIWSAVSAFIDEQYKQKVSILSGEDYQAQLQDVFGSDILPEHLGGKEGNTYY